MKRLIIIAVLLMGCATTNTVPFGKTVDNDWEKDWKYCQSISGKVTGPLAVTPYGIMVNKSGADSKYDSCMRELGWIK